MMAMREVEMNGGSTMGPEAVMAWVEPIPGRWRKKRERSRWERWVVVGNWAKGRPGLVQARPDGKGTGSA
jgi:hypothetical protein